VFWNPRGVDLKHGLLKQLLKSTGAAYGGCSETQSYKNNSLSDGDWNWDSGTESLPKRGTRSKGGTGAFVHKTRTKASLVHVGEYTVWHRLEPKASSPPVFVGVGYFPQDSRFSLGLKEFIELATKFKAMGQVIFGGDLNARTGSNGDTTTNSRGISLLNAVDNLGLVLVNKLATRCKDSFTRVEPSTKGMRETTIDYVICSRDLADRVTSLSFHPDQMGSDHKPLVLKVNLSLAVGAKPSMRTVWCTDNIVSPPNDWSWVNACKSVFSDWISHTGRLTQALEAMGAENSRIADILDWSFQRELDAVCESKLGCKVTGSRPATRVPRAIQLLNDQRRVCESVLKQCMNDSSVTNGQRSAAKANFLASRRAVTSASRRLKSLEEATLFADIEANQGNSALFWNKVKALRASTEGNKSPPRGR
jgi:hypothetical protein